MNREKKKSTLRTFLLRLTGPLIFVLIFVYYVRPEDVLHSLSRLRWDYFAAALALIPASVWIRASRWKQILVNYGIRFTQWKCVKIVFLSTLTASLVSALGAFIKVFYFKRDSHGMTRPVLSVLGEKILDLTLPLVFGLAAFILLRFHLLGNYGIPALLLLGFLFYLLLRWLMRLTHLKLFRSFVRRRFPEEHWTRKIDEHADKFDQALDFKVYALSVADFLIAGCLKMFLLLKALGMDFSLTKVMFVASVNDLSALLPISYLGLGTREAGLIGAYHLLDGTGRQAIALSMTILIYRLVMVCMGAVFWFMEPPPVRSFKMSAKHGESPPVEGE